MCVQKKEKENENRIVILLLSSGRPSNSIDNCLLCNICFGFVCVCFFFFIRFCVARRTMYSRKINCLWSFFRSAKMFKIPREIMIFPSVVFYLRHFSTIMLIKLKIRQQISCRIYYLYNNAQRFWNCLGAHHLIVVFLKNFCRVSPLEYGTLMLESWI